MKGNNSILTMNNCYSIYRNNLDTNIKQAKRSNHDNCVY